MVELTSESTYAPPPVFKIFGPTPSSQRQTADCAYFGVVRTWRSGAVLITNDQLPRIIFTTALVPLRFRVGSTSVPEFKGRVVMYPYSAAVDRLLPVLRVSAHEADEDYDPDLAVRTLRSLPAAADPRNLVRLDFKNRKG